MIVKNIQNGWMSPRTKPIGEYNTRIVFVLKDRKDGTVFYVDYSLCTWNVCKEKTLKDNKLLGWRYIPEFIEDESEGDA